MLWTQPQGQTMQLVATAAAPLVVKGHHPGCSPKLQQIRRLQHQQVGTVYAESLLSFGVVCWIGDDLAVGIKWVAALAGGFSLFLWCLFSLQALPQQVVGKQISPPLSVISWG